MIWHFSNIKIHFVFCQMNFIVLSPFLLKYHYIFFIIIVFRLKDVIGGWAFFFVSALLFPIRTLLSSASFVSLSCCILAVPMDECLGKHSCMRSPFPKDILKGIFLFPLCESNESLETDRY